MNIDMVLPKRSSVYLRERRAITSRYGSAAGEISAMKNFLDKGKKYVATIYQDAKNANYKTNPQAYVITKKTVTSKSVLKLNSVAGGGFAISILAQ